jgi:protein-S-isoprenylcysteine O-methyltransferase Ste14
LVALITSILITVAMAVPIVVMARRRKPGDRLSWGEAMVGGIYVFFLAFLAFGTVPHQWLAYADNELNWRKDAIVFGPGGSMLPQLPFSVTKETFRDIVVSGIYAVGLGMLVFAWVWWQKRGKPKPAATAVATSGFGRPLVRKS